MAALAKLIQFIFTLAALAGAIETIIRLVRLAWSLALKLQQLLRRKATATSFAAKAANKVAGKFNRFAHP